MFAWPPPGYHVQCPLGRVAAIPIPDNLPPRMEASAA